jgi:hypothetical protein
MTSSRDRVVKPAGGPLLAEVEGELRRGNFLRDDDRSLAQTLADDAAEVSRRGLDMDAAVLTLRRLFDLGRKGLGDRVKVDDMFEVTVREDRGIIPCPWEDHFAAAKAVVNAVNLRTGKTIRFSALALHMVAAHRFFQGKGSPFRIEPSDLAEFLHHVAQP